MAQERLITCSHCRSEIPHGANVCKGCRAEIKYGTPGLFMFVGFIIPLVVGFFPAKLWVVTLGFNETIAYFIWGVVTVVGWFLATKFCSKMFRNHVSFTRLKNQ